MTYENDRESDENQIDADLEDLTPSRDPIVRVPTLLIPAVWLAIQGLILLVGLAYFTFRPGVLAERFPGFMAGAVMAAILLGTAWSLARGRTAAHIAAVLLFFLEAMAFIASLARGSGGSWALVQLGLCLVMLLLLLSRPTRRAINRMVPAGESPRPLDGDLF